MKYLQGTGNYFTIAIIFAAIFIIAAIVCGILIYNKFGR